MKRARDVFSLPWCCVLLSPTANGFDSSSFCTILFNKPSTVVKSPPKDPCCSSSSSSGTAIIAVSDFSTSLDKSSAQVMVSITSEPAVGTPPPPFTSFVLKPHWSQLNARISTSLKWGIDVTADLELPISRQWGQGVGISHTPKSSPSSMPEESMP
eukprot:CAMPEP_0173292880 /NCGR_PEP_ID=MMETSP1143-20121109/12980_1 /TAXON_ID=483371 /ORGANISM="non described non described, Strain CCMP2298" /LENGTH=155 /DNA_ID=CAMNT_0014232329 /DNA_START=382 /DNA_END=845 /DNA_ORIENTATION=+